jgi:hypothetical protein
LGEPPSLWLEPQPWALLAAACPRDRAEILVSNINRKLRDPSPIGAMLCNADSKESASKDRGIAEEGGVWPSINATLVWGLSSGFPDFAWSEFQKNMLSRHASAYPTIWYGIWSGPDTYNSILDSQYPGGTQQSDLIRRPGQIMESVYTTDFGMTDFPVMNMHPHSGTLIGASKMTGLDCTPEGIIVDPLLPEDEYAFESHLVGLVRTKASLRGWYTPKVQGIWSVTIKRRPWIPASTRLVVNGRTFAFRGGTSVIGSGEGGPGNPLAWDLSL